MRKQCDMTEIGQGWVEIVDIYISHVDHFDLPWLAGLIVLKQHADSTPAATYYSWGHILCTRERDT